MAYDLESRGALLSMDAVSKVAVLRRESRTSHGRTCRARRCPRKQRETETALEASSANPCKLKRHCKDVLRRTRIQSSKDGIICDAD